MLLSLIYFAVRRLLPLVTVSGNRDDVARDVELLVLRRQLRVLSRSRHLRLKRRDRILFAAASGLLPPNLWLSLPVTPQTVLCWHRELVRRKWTYRSKRLPGRPRVGQETATLIIRLARENPRWGYRRIQGELRKLGVFVSATGICAVLRRRGLPPAPRRDGPSWREFLTQQAAGIMACDFFCVETVGLKTLYVLFFIELSTRRVHLAGVTKTPGSTWVTQQARNLAMEGRLVKTDFLIRDRDAKYSGPFDEVFRSEGLRVIQTPVQAPNANAFAERFVRTIRNECLDRTLVFGERHLKKILREFVRHYNTERPHRGLSLETPEPQPGAKLTAGKVVRVAKLGGLINEYHRIAA